MTFVRLVHVAFALWVTASGLANADTLWSLGTPDGDYREFAVAGRYEDYARRFPQDVTYRVGVSRPERDWPFIQPGPTDAWAGLRAHPFRIEFDLDAVPSGACRLNLDFVNTHYGQAPLLEVDINGRARYRLQLPPGGPDASLSDPKAGRRTALSLPFPSRHLAAGRNRITLTVVAGSWLLYDAVRLESGAEVPMQPEIATLEAGSTMLFRRVDGELRQALRVTVNNVGIEGSGEARLTGARQQAQQVSLGPGANTFYLFVTPFDRAAALRLTLSAGGKARAVSFEGRPERRWRLYCAPSAHTDIGYTDLQERIFARHTENTRRALQAGERMPDFKWNLEVGYQAPMLRKLAPSAYPDLVRRMREGRVGLQGLYLNMLTGICSGEELAQALERAQAIGQAGGFPVVSANLTDVPTSVGTLPTLLAAAGVRYFAEGCNEDRGPIFRYADPRMVQSPVWWEGPDGSRVLAVFARGYAQMGGLGLTHSAEETAVRLPGWLRGFDRKDYPCDAVFVYGAFSDNERMDPGYAESARAWNQQWEYPKILVSRVDEFFRYVEGRFGRTLPVFRGDLGSYWEDGAGSSAFETALARQAKTRLEAAERLNALATAHGLAKPVPPETFRAAWDDVLFYDEHTWGAAGSIADPEGAQTKGQWAYKATYATRAAAQADRLALTPALNPASGVIVWNTLSWPRDILVSVPVSGGATQARETGGAGRLMPVQRSGDRLLFLARQVPPLGWRRYRLEKGARPASPPLLKPGADAFTWETPEWRLKLDSATGAVVSLRAKQDGREWVDGATGYGLNQFLYVQGGGGGMIHPFEPIPTLTVSTHTAAQVTAAENGPLRAALHIARTGLEGCPADTWIVFTPGGRLDFVNVLHKTPTYAKEAGYFAFPFRLPRRDARRAFVELPYGCVEVEKGQIPGACREWFSADGYAAVTDGSATALLATPHAPLLTVNDVWRGQWRGTLGRLNGALFSYAFNNYWHTNYKASQGGDMVFAYSLRLRSGGFDPAEAARFGREALAAMPDPRGGAQPRVWADDGSEARPTARPAAPEGSLLRVARGGVLVGGVRWNGGRLVARLYNPTGRSVRAAVRLPGLRVRQAWQTDLTGGRNRRPAAAQGDTVEATVPARGLTTLALRVERRTR